MNNKLGFRKEGPVAVVGLAISAYSAYSQYQAGKDASKAAKKQAKLEQAKQDAQGRASSVEAQRQRIQEVRQARIRRAQVEAAGAGGGVLGSSGVLGGVGSITSQSNANVQHINNQEGLALSVGNFNNQIAEQQTNIFQSQAKAAQWQTIGSFGKGVFEAGGGFTTIFGGNTNKQAGK